MRKQIVLPIILLIGLALTGCSKQYLPILVRSKYYLTNHYSYMDINKGNIIGFNYYWAYPFTENGIAKAYDIIGSKTKGVYSETVLLDKKGKEFLKFNTLSETIQDDRRAFGIWIDPPNPPNELIYNQYVRWGYLDSIGNTVIPAMFVKAYDFENKVAIVEKDELFSLIDTEGKILRSFPNVTRIKQACNGIFPFTTGYVDKYGTLEAGSKWGYMRTDGKTIAQEIYSDITVFSDGFGLATIQDSDGSWLTHIIDTEGKVCSTVKCQSQYIRTSFIDGFAVVRINNFDGVIKSNGEWFINPDQYYSIEYGEGYFVVWDISKEKSIVFDRNLKQLFTCDYPCTRFLNGLSFYMKDSRYYAMDIYGKTILQIREGYIPEGFVGLRAFHFTDWASLKKVK